LKVAEAGRDHGGGPKKDAKKKKKVESLQMGMVNLSRGSTRTLQDFSDGGPLR